MQLRDLQIPHILTKPQHGHKGMSMSAHQEPEPEQMPSSRTPIPAPGKGSGQFCYHFPSHTKKQNTASVPVLDVSSVYISKANHRMAM